MEAKSVYTKQMENIIENIHETFEQLHHALDRQKEVLLRQANTIKETEFDLTNNNGLLLNFNQQIKQYLEEISAMDGLLNKSVEKYKHIMTNSTQCNVFMLSPIFLWSYSYTFIYIFSIKTIIGI